MSSKIPGLAVNYTRVTNQALGLAVKLAAGMQQEKKAALDLVPSAVALLKERGLIDEHQTKMASTQLGDHSETIGILMNVINNYEDQLKTANAKVASANLGKPADSAGESNARGHAKNANYAGYRRGDDDPVDEATRTLARGLGVQLSR